MHRGRQRTSAAVLALAAGISLRVRAFLPIFLNVFSVLVLLVPRFCAACEARRGWGVCVHEGLLPSG